MSAYIIRDKHEIIVCPSCDGTGRWREQIGNPRDWTYRRTPCARCNGTGRVVRVTTVTEHPYAEPDLATAG